MLPPAPPRRDRGTAERLDRHWPRTPVPSCSHCRHDHAPPASPYPCRSSHRATAPTNRSAKPSATAYSTTHGHKPTQLTTMIQETRPTGQHSIVKTLTMVSVLACGHTIGVARPVPAGPALEIATEGAASVRDSHYLRPTTSHSH